MPLQMNCPSEVGRGEKAECEVRPRNSNFDTRETFYGWTVVCLSSMTGNNECDETFSGYGRRKKKWSGKATMTATIRAHASYRENDSTLLLYIGAETRTVTVRPRTG